MAGKGGGAWKVAYADFVTAMMAFFMVMWLISQDSKVKESIAHYFTNPVGWRLVGNSKNPGSTGNIFHSDFTGPVAGSRNRSVGHGIGEGEEPDFDETETQVVADWLLEDPADRQQWTAAAKRKLQWAKEHFPQPDDGVSLDQLAARQLAMDMRNQVLEGALEQSSGIYQDLLLSTLSKVNWDAIATECMKDCGTGGR